MSSFTYPLSSLNISGLALESKQDTMITHLSAIQTAVQLLDNAINGSEMQVDVVTSALPTGAATSAYQSTANGFLGTIASDTTSIDGKITACNTGAVTISSALPAGSNTIGSVYVMSATPKDFLDSGLVDASSTNITTAGLQVVASLAATCTVIDIVEDIGEYMALTDGSDTILAYLPLGGGQIWITIAAGTTLKLKSLTGSSITSGKIAMNFLGPN